MANACSQAVNFPSPHVTPRLRPWPSKHKPLLTSPLCVKLSRDFEVFLWSLPELQLHLVLTALTDLHQYI